MYVENSFFANLNDTPLRMSLWADCIGNVVEMHRDAFAKGIDLWAWDNAVARADGTVERANEISPAYYNMIVNGWMDGTMVHLWSGQRRNSPHVGPPMFGNYVMQNKVRQPHMARTGFDSLGPVSDGGITVGNRSGADMTKPEGDSVGLSHSFILGNFVSFTSAGIVVADCARKTFLIGNQFQEVSKPILDWGARTLIRGNSIYSLDESGEHHTDVPDRENEREIPAKKQPQ
jgi:hypothetical protein